MPFEPARPTVVERAAFKPGKCAVTHDIDGPFLDCGVKYENRGYWHRLYLHLPWIEQQARQHLGMVPKSEIAGLKARVERAEAELEAIQIQAKAISSAEKALEAVKA